MGIADSRWQKIAAINQPPPSQGCFKSLWMHTGSITAIAAAGLCLMGSPAYAQSDDTAPRVADDEIVVIGTGTRISGFTTPTPVTTISSEELELAGKFSVQQLEEDYPAFIPNQATQRVSAPPGGSTFNLRGLGSSRTLLLFDGRRVAPTSPQGTVDVNIIPVSLIERAEIVTGGASAAYGSDAVAGVVNLILDKDFDGGEAYGQLGLSERGDSFERSASLTYGAGFADDRGRVLVTGSYYEIESVSNQTARPWGRQEWAQYANPDYVEGNTDGETRLLLVPYTRHANMTAGGVISSGPLRGTEFGPNGVPEPFVYGTKVGSVFMIGGDGSTFSPTGNLTPDIQRLSSYGRLSYDLTDSVEFWAEAMYTRSAQRNDVTPNYDSGSLTIQIDNAYLPQSIRDRMIMEGVTDFRLGRAEYELGFNIADSVYNIGRYALGFDGNFGNSWNWDLYYQYSHNKYDYKLLNNRIQSNWFQAIDPVVDPMSGEIVCRSTISDPNNGCVPANLFGPGAISDEAVSYLTGTTQLLQTQTQHDIGINLQGTIIENWAGDIAFAIGGEYRKDATKGTSDAISLARDWRVLNPQPLEGEQTVKEGYAEIVVPLLSNTAFADLLEINAAGRLTDYTLSGLVTTWKGGLNYIVNDEIRLRATRSRDIRAPNINDLFESRGANPNPVIDPLTNQNVATIVSTGGNPDLEPEKADTWTAGVVLSPTWAPGFQASVDYYNIKIDDAISSRGSQAVVDGCYILGQTNLCSGVTRDPITNAITEVRAVRFNADQVETSGLDIEMQYRTALTGINPNWNGDLSFRLLSTYVHKLVTTTNGVSEDDAGSVQGGVPHWRVNMNTIYNDGPFTLNALFRWVQGGTRSNNYIEGIDIADNSIKSRFYINLGAQFEIGDSVTIFTKIDNVLDTFPPVTTNGVISPQTATSQYFDVLGRRYAAGVRIRF